MPAQVIDFLHWQRSRLRALRMIVASQGDHDRAAEFMHEEARIMIFYADKRYPPDPSDPTRLAG